MDAGDWLSAEEACERLGVGIMKLARWVSDGTVAAEGFDGRMWFRRSDVDRQAANVPGRSRRRSDRPPPAPTAAGPPSSEEEILEQAQLVARFVVAYDNVKPGPCPVCGDVMRPKEWPAHLLEHRRR